MRFIKILLVVAVVYGVYANWDNLGLGGSTAVAEVTAHGFVPVVVVMPDGVSKDTVVIYTVPHCPSGVAQRVRSLSKALSSAGIKHHTSSSYVVSRSNASAAFKQKMQQTFEAIEAGGMVVLVVGYGRVDPSVEQVVAQYKATH